MVKQISYERARNLFDYKDGLLFWRRMESGRRPDLRVGFNASKRTVRIRGEFYQLHYLVWNWHFGETEYHLAFKDGDRQNARIENLIQVSKSIAYTPKAHRMVPREDLLPPQPMIIGGKLQLTDLRVNCPCCGQTVANIPPSMISIKYGLSPIQEKILDAVWRGAGRPVSSERIFDAMYEDNPDGGHSPQRMYATMKESMVRMKQKLEGSGIGIENAGYRAGFRLVLGNKSKGN